MFFFYFVVFTKKTMSNFRKNKISNKIYLKYV
jgi:hypothetical protein